MSKTNEAVNPCQGICQFNTQINMCVACFRSTLERSTWPMMAEAEKQTVLQMIRLRRFKLQGLKAGNVEPPCPL